ncbi:MAG: hypothetical protein JNM43_17135 [Planctomycetaceae bacterium]|nr:hypothetical protein [Planctomycetaceae bacterium]
MQSGSNWRDAEDAYNSAEPTDRRWDRGDGTEGSFVFGVTRQPGGSGHLRA